MDDSDKPFEEDLVNNNTKLNDTYTPLHTEETTSSTEEGASNLEPSEDFEENKFRIFKNSDLMAKIGVPKNFAAVGIKGFVGDEEVEQVSRY